MTSINWKLENDVNDWVKGQFGKIDLIKHSDYNEESAMSDYMKEALRGSAKTNTKSKYGGRPDFHVEKYDIPVIIENKLGLNKLISETKSGIKSDEKSVNSYAVNGAIYYAQSMIASKKYEEVVAIGIAGNREDDVKISVYYVFSATIPPKRMEVYSTLDFLQNQKSFQAFYREATVTEKEKHKILIKTRDEILVHAKKLNKLMNNHNISTEQRVVYISGMLLSMQDVYDDKNEIIDEGLVPEDLKGIQTEQKRDSVVIMKHLEGYLDQKQIPAEKKRMMVDSFMMSISMDNDRDQRVDLDKIVSNMFKDPVSVTKQVFTYLYENIYRAIDLTHGALDIMAEMYSTFIKYALSDGASLGKVLTPPYITTLMAKILDVNMNSRVMDLATGSAAFLVASMSIMIDDTNYSFGKDTESAKKKIKEIKNDQLLGVEVDAKMYTLAATNMILRGDGSSQIKKANTFKTPPTLYTDFNADRLLLNPPFSYAENGMPFFEFGLNHMQKGGKGAIIIQDSSGSGKSVQTNKRILAKHTMLASIKMPSDLFSPNAGVQTSIYIFEVGKPHNFKTDIVKFIDFRNDGYKRNGRGIKEIDHPTERYQDLYTIYKMGLNAIKDDDFNNDLWDLNEIYVEDTISESGGDWNFEQHKVNDNTPTEEDFLIGVSDYLSWELSLLLKEGESNNGI